MLEQAIALVFIAHIQAMNVDAPFVVEVFDSVAACETTNKVLLKQKLIEEPGMCMPIADLEGIPFLISGAYVPPIPGKGI